MLARFVIQMENLRRYVVKERGVENCCYHLAQNIVGRKRVVVSICIHKFSDSQNQISKR